MESKIVICMGSSCFSRGNNKNLKIVQEFLNKNNLNTKVELTGNLCEEKCSKGPNISLNGQLFSNIEPNTLYDLLKRAYGK